MTQSGFRVITKSSPQLMAMVKDIMGPMVGQPVANNSVDNLKHSTFLTMISLLQHCKYIHSKIFPILLAYFQRCLLLVLPRQPREAMSQVACQLLLLLQHIYNGINNRCLQHHLGISIISNMEKGFDFLLVATD